MRALLTLTLAAALCAAPVNLLRNGGFEDGVTGWRLAQGKGGTVVMVATDVQPHEGKACLSMRGIADWACGESEHIPLEAGRVYTFRGYARATRGDVFLQISYWKGNVWLGMSQSDAVTTDGEWQACTVSTERAKFKDATSISLSGTARGGNVEAWFDALELTETP